METFDDICSHMFTSEHKIELIEAEEFATEKMPQGIKI